MNQPALTTAAAAAQRNLFGTPLPMLESSIDMSQIVAETATDLLKVALERAASVANHALAHIGHVWTSGDASYLLWELPVEYRLQAERWVSALNESFDIVSRAQRQALELQGVCASQLTGETSKTMLKLNAAVASRRETAEVIHFSDRRTG